jgi:hypothetical protein
MEENIRNLLAYSFTETGKIISYEHLTETERSIVTKSEYNDIIMFIKGKIDIKENPIK